MEEVRLFNLKLFSFIDPPKFEMLYYSVTVLACTSCNKIKYWSTQYKQCAELFIIHVRIGVIRGFSKKRISLYVRCIGVKHIENHIDFTHIQRTYRQIRLFEKPLKKQLFPVKPEVYWLTIQQCTVLHYM